jgi:uncharacterized protein YrrD
LRGKEIIGLPVIDLETGESIAEVKGVVFDSNTRTLQALVLEKATWLKPPVGIAFEDVRAIGPAAVTIPNKGVVQPLNRNEDWLTNLRPENQIAGHEVITETGENLGRVDDVVFDEQEGVIRRLVVSDSLLQDLVSGRREVDFPEQAVMGKDNLILPHAADEIGE